MTEFAEAAESIRRAEEPKTVEEWMARINAQFDAIDAMVEDSKAVLRKWHEQRAHDTGAAA